MVLANKVVLAEEKETAPSLGNQGRRGVGWGWGVHTRSQGLQAHRGTRPMQAGGVKVDGSQVLLGQGRRAPDTAAPASWTPGEACMLALAGVRAGAKRAVVKPRGAAPTPGRTPAHATAPSCPLPDRCPCSVSHLRSPQDPDPPPPSHSRCSSDVPT